MTKSKWGLGDLLIIATITMLALGFFTKNTILITAGLIMGFTLTGLYLFLYPKMKREMLDEERKGWDDMK